MSWRCVKCHTQFSGEKGNVTHHLLIPGASLVEQLLGTNPDVA